MTLKQRIGRLVSAGALLLGLAACPAPYIPVPPPAAPAFTGVMVPDGMGGTRRVWEVRSGMLGSAANAKFYIYNATGQTGVITKARPDGSYVAGLLEGQIDDKVEIWYETPKAELSPSVCWLLADGVAQQPCP